jgi:TPR repeat protein
VRRSGLWLGGFVLALPMVATAPGGATALTAETAAIQASGDRPATLLAQAINLDGLKQLSRPDPGAECDRLAASDFDKDRPPLVPGVPIARLAAQADAAIAACRAAVADAAAPVRYQFELARALQASGQGAEAAAWYRKAVDAGNLLAMNNLAVFYESGAGGLPLDQAEATRLLEKAATGGLAIAMAGLGQRYELGLGAAMSYDLAQSWYEKSAAAGYVPAMTRLGWLLISRNGVSPDYQQARSWFEKAAAAGDAPAMVSLGDYYLQGINMDRDYAQARAWYEKGAAGGQPVGMRRLALMYLSGDGGPQDDKAAATWLQRAVANGDPTSSYYLGMLSLSGRGVPNRVDRRHHFSPRRADGARQLHRGAIPRPFGRLPGRGPQGRPGFPGQERGAQAAAHGRRFRRQHQGGAGRVGP